MEFETGMSSRRRAANSNSSLENLEFVIPNELCEARFLRPARFVGVRKLSFPGVLDEEGFIPQKTCDAKPYLASLGMTPERIFQQPSQESC